MDPFKDFLAFLPSQIMIKVSSDAHSMRQDASEVFGIFFFFQL